jgi:diadenylate cyclase
VFRDLTSYAAYEIVIELAVIWVFIYLAFRFLRGTRGAGVIRGFAVLLVVLILLQVLGQVTDAFERVNFIYDKFLSLLYILLIVVFQPELRQAAIRIGHTRVFRAGRHATAELVDALTEATTFLSKNQFGAIIAVERVGQLGGLVEGGQALDAKVSSRMIESIFWPNSPLHDLGVVIRGDRILAAGVQFPMAEEGALPGKYGARHRAGVGLTIDSDCLVIIVSEETGGISLVEHGQMTPSIAPAALREHLSQRLMQPAEPETTEEATTQTGSEPESVDRRCADA